MASKRRNLLSRKLRPKSTVGMGQGASADDIPDLVPPLNEQLGSGHDDPDANEEEPGVNVDESQADVSRKSAPLKHLGLSRPKKPKTRLPTRSAALRVGGNSETASQESLDVDGDLSQGLDTFFHSTTMATTTGAYVNDNKHSFQGLSTCPRFICFLVFTFCVLFAVLWNRWEQRKFRQ